MQIAQLTGIRQFQLVEGPPLPEPGPGEIQVRIESVGICGSDVHSYCEGGVGDSPCIYPMVLGHEPAGTVVKTGAGVTGWSAGDRAALEPAIYCYHCEFCRTGRHNICENIVFLSTPGNPGFFRQYVNLPEKCVLPIPANVSLGLATVAEPLAVALHSMKFTDLKAGDSVAVFGAGPIGLLTIASLKLAGAGRIFAVEPAAHRREFAKAMGATEAIDPGAVDPAAEIMNSTGKRGVDIAIDCAAKKPTTNWAIRAVRNGGRVVITGIHSEILVPVEVSPMRRKELAIFNVRRSNHSTEKAVELLGEHERWFGALITHTRPMSEIGEAFSMAEHVSGGIGKLIIKP